MLELRVNGKVYRVEDSPETPLLSVIRESLGLTGTKFGCGMALCGACTLYLDGEAIRSCITPVSRAVGKEITTIEGLSADLNPLQKGWLAEDVSQCGSFQSGSRIVDTVLPREKPNPTGADIVN
jgi:isoquinoline 1-oxidoreductase alpha subunit